MTSLLRSRYSSTLFTLCSTNLILEVLGKTLILTSLMQKYLSRSHDRCLRQIPKANFVFKMLFPPFEQLLCMLHVYTGAPVNKTLTKNVRYIHRGACEFLFNPTDVYSFVSVKNEIRIYLVIKYPRNFMCTF